ncbi:MAG: hypothetical protein HY290_30680 [Planctomycetia bacterium]|nr:hypothetical protein [Planctomycetia bacterium]
MEPPSTLSPAESSVPRFEYFRGYPGRFRRERRKNIGCSLSWNGPFFVAALVGSICTIYAAVEFHGWKEAVQLTVFLGLTAFFGFGLWITLRVASQTTIVPYFQKALGDIDTFAQGHAVARSCQALDALADQLGLTPLSAFGFNDDLAGETVVWHPPAQGLATVAGLVASLKTTESLSPDRDLLIKELSNIEHALQKATDANVPFCLLLRTADVTSAIEWERRQGTCF